MTEDAWATAALDAPEFLPYLEAAADGHLVIPRCENCNRYQFPPRAQCRYCTHASFTWPKVTCVGGLYSWTTTYRALAPVLSGSVPLTIAIVTLDLPDPVRLVGRVNADPSDPRIAIGARMSGEFVPVTSERRPDNLALTWHLMG